MIIIHHNREHVVKVENLSTKSSIPFDEKNIQKLLVHIAKSHKDDLLIWKYDDENIVPNIQFAKEICHHNLVIASFSLSGDYVIPKEYGYSEMVSPFLNINRSVTYPSWLMSSDIGVISAKALLEFSDLLHYNLNFDEFLCYLAKLGMKKGLFCYSAPDLVIGTNKTPKRRTSYFKLFRFLKSTYSVKWLFVLLWNLFFYEKKLPLFSFLKSLFGKKVVAAIDLSRIEVQSSKKMPSFEYDVIIPTLKRAKYLKDVLLDFSKQEILPKNVIIVEQDEFAETELHYLKEESWDFNIIHKCIDQFGVCNARNVALNEIRSNWAFLADDDIRIKDDFITQVKKVVEQYGFDVVNLSCLQSFEESSFKEIIQWTTFGSGTTFLTSKSVKDIRFSMSHEFGYGEDEDFGLQVRHSGVDVTYAPIKILHLKAPIGGFRNKIQTEWKLDKPLPSPSPTVMMNYVFYKTSHQVRGYKTLVLLNKIMKSNPITFFKTVTNFNKHWKRSVYWANRLRKEHEI